MMKILVCAVCFFFLSVHFDYHFKGLDLELLKQLGNKWSSTEMGAV